MATYSTIAPFDFAGSNLSCALHLQSRSQQAWAGLGWVGWAAHWLHAECHGRQALHACGHCSACKCGHADGVGIQMTVT
jgi:hypothetical protein